MFPTFFHCPRATQQEEEQMERQPQQRAAQYLRMSTEQQQYSTENQAAAIQVYATVRGLEIVATYRDEGKSGLNIAGRPGLQALLHDVESGSAAFDVILVYDVSRWGRFQDADESAFYEFLCRRAGIGVEYCAEQFQNDGSSLSTIIKSIKRAMAAEYSRELSTKVFLGQRRLIEKGHLLGGIAGYGFRRQIVDPHGLPKVVLSHGQWKNIREDRIVVIPGPREEIETIDWIFKRYIGGAKELHIAEELQKRGLRTDNGRPFSAKLVHSVLTSERYIGVNVWNRSSSKLKGRRVRNDPKQWVRYPNAFPQLIDVGTFQAAQVERKKRLTRLSDDDLLEPLKALLKRHGKLTIEIIDKANGIPIHTSYVQRFGSMRRVYELIGYRRSKDCRYADINQQFRKSLANVSDHLCGSLVAAGFIVERSNWKRFVLETDCKVMLCLSRFRRTVHQTLGWHVPPTRFPTDIFVIARPNSSGNEVADYFVVPQSLLSALQFNVTECKARALYQDYWCSDIMGIAEKVEMVRNEMLRGVQYRLKGHDLNLTIELEVFPPSVGIRTSPAMAL